MPPVRSCVYDIVYSQICHGPKECVIELIKNIEHFNKNNKFLVCLHLNNEMYELRDSFENEFCIVNDKHYDKFPGNETLFKPILENFDFVRNKGYKFNNYMSLTSSCWFIKQIPKFEKREIKFRNLNESSSITNVNIYKKHRYWKKFYSNDKIIETFNNCGVKIMRDYVPGRLYSYELIDKINEYIKKECIFEKLTVPIYYEEFILISLINYFIVDVTADAPVLCYHFEKPSGTARIPKILEIQIYNKNADGLSIIKRIPLNEENQVYKYISSLSE